MTTIKSILNKASKNNDYNLLLNMLLKDSITLFKEKEGNPDVNFQYMEDYLKNIFIISDYQTTKDINLYNCIYLKETISKEEETKQIKALTEIINDLQNALYLGEINIFVALDINESGKAEELVKKLEGLFKNNELIHVYFTRLTHKPLREATAQNKTSIQEEMGIRINNPHNDFKMFSNKHYLTEYQETAEKEIIPSGFKSIDSLLHGGFYSGFYVIGAVSSLGKTNFCLNLATEFARKGNPVIYYSLEMTRESLISRIIASEQFTLEKNNARYFKGKIKEGAFNIAYNKNNCRKNNEFVAYSIKEYGEKVADNMFIVENKNDLTINKIESGIIDYIETNKDKPNYKKPIIFIDYLQIIKATDTRLTTKQSLDNIIGELELFTREHGLIVIGISSLNRESYTKTIDMASFKETGAIEYSADLILGLEYSFVKSIEQDKKENKTRKDYAEELTKILQANASDPDNTPIEIMVKILKQRDGARGERTLYLYPKYSHFEEGIFIEEEIKKTAPKTDLFF